MKRLGWRSFLRSLKFMVSPYHPPKRPTYPIDDNLVLRQLAQRDLIGDREPIGNRKLVQENSYRESTKWSWDSLGTPVDYDDLPNG